MAVAPKSKCVVVQKAPSVPLSGPLKFCCFAEDIAGVVPLLSPPNSPLARATYGEEQVVMISDGILVARSAKYQRYVLTTLNPPPGCCGGAVLEVRLSTGKRQPDCIEAVFVMPWARRQGMASRLLSRALQDFPHLTVDGYMTAEGAAFFGYALAQAPARMRGTMDFLSRHGKK